MGKVVEKGELLIREWDYATTRLKTAKNAMNAAERDVTSAKNALGKWLMPPDAEVGEKFSVWHGDSLIECTVTVGDPSIRIRTRGVKQF